MSAAIQLGVGTGEGQEQGVEGHNVVPPATHVTQTPCLMHFDYWDDERCENDAAQDHVFCANCIGVQLCKASFIEYQSGGNSWGWITFIKTIPPHPVDAYEDRTKRAQFCSDRCRNLWRDTKKRRERQVEVAKLESGGKSDKYMIIDNYSNTGTKVVVSKETGRIVS